METTRESCQGSHIVKAEWTMYGKSTGNQPPEKWTRIRIKLKNNNEFLLTKDDLSKIPNWVELWGTK